MQVHFSYQHGSRDPQVDKIIDLHIGKLAQLLGRFSPDLVKLHGVVEFSTANHGPLCSLSLWLPTARLHAGERGRDLPTAVRASFDHLLEQVKKHKEVLRREGEWKRKRYKFQLEAEELQAGELRVQDRQQLRDYMEQVLPQLKRFIARELRYQEMSGMLQVQKVEEILDEVVARALENHRASSADSAPFHHLLKEAIHVMNGSGSEPSAFSPPKSAEPSADRELRSYSPEGKPDAVDLCLAFLPAKKRQVYVLRALEGFSYEEAGQALGQLPSEVEEIFGEVSRGVSATLQAGGPANPPSKPSSA